MITVPVDVMRTNSYLIETLAVFRLFLTLQKEARRIARQCNKLQPINGEIIKTFGNVFSGFAASKAARVSTNTPL